MKCFFFIEHMFILYIVNNQKRKEWRVMTKWKKDCFIIELKLLIDPWQKDILLKRFEIARTLYNTTLSYAVKQYTF
ncbi:hypothetical protein AN161_22200, partial [Lysinibacillus sp. FJAT-14222]